MTPKATKTAAKPARATGNPAKPTSTPVALRVNDNHLAALDALSKKLGCQRSALIQMAIGEFIERRSR